MVVGYNTTLVAIRPRLGVVCGSDHYFGINTEMKNDRRQLYVMELFGGIGGGILGHMLCGHHVVCAVELDAYCRAVLVRRQNDGDLPPFPIWDDVRTFDGRRWRGVVDVVSGGFPCQPFSSAGKQLGADDERNMFGETIRIIQEVQPKFVFLENVPQLLRTRCETCVCGWSSGRRGVHTNLFHERQEETNAQESEKRIIPSLNSNSDVNQSETSADDYSARTWWDYLRDAAEDESKMGRPDTVAYNRGLCGKVDRTNRTVFNTETSASGTYQTFSRTPQTQNNLDKTDTRPGRESETTNARPQQEGQRKCEQCGRVLGGTGFVWFFEEILQTLSSIGYDAEWCVLGASDVGAPHYRKRCWILAHANGRPAFPVGGGVGEAAESAECHRQKNRAAGFARRASADERRDSMLGLEHESGESSKRNDETNDSNAESAGCAQSNQPMPVSASGSAAGGVGMHVPDTENRRHVRRVGKLSEIEGLDGQRTDYSGGTPGYGSREWWEIESPLDRVVDGISHRLERIRGLGNAQVPLCAATAWRILYERINGEQ